MTLRSKIKYIHLKLIIIAHRVGFEPTTPTLTAFRSDQLSYQCNWAGSRAWSGNLWLGKPMFYQLNYSCNLINLYTWGDSNPRKTGLKPVAYSHVRHKCVCTPGETRTLESKILNLVRIPTSATEAFIFASVTNMFSKMSKNFATNTCFS